jgi:probable F420-dependent oxidoreductase
MLAGVTERRPVLSAFGAGRSLRQVQDLARQVEAAEFGTLWLAEGTQPVLSMCSAAALGTSSLALGTSVAVAFARSPMLTAQAAWMLAEATDGRFVIGLGTQVRAHVERRFSAAFAHPGPRLREYIEAMRAIYAAFRGEAKLQFTGDFYSFSLLTPMWSPGPIAHPDPPIYAAGVREWMCEMIGEVADGLLVHPLSTTTYLDQIVVPAVRRGEDTAARPPGTVRMVCPVMTAVSDDDEVRRRQRDGIRSRLAFYGSTPGYGIVFDVSGWPGTGERLTALQRQGDLRAMKETITDEMLDAFAITSTWDELPGKLLDRFGNRADDVVCYSVLEQWTDEHDSLERWQDVNRRFAGLGASRSTP